MLLGLAALSKHATEQATRPDLRVAMRNRDPMGHSPLFVRSHPELVVTAPGEREPVPLKDGPELVEARRHELAARLLGEAEALEPAELGRIEQRNVPGLLGELGGEPDVTLADVVEPVPRRRDHSTEGLVDVGALGRDV